MSADATNTIARNIRFVAHSDQGGRPDGVQVMVHRGYAYIGHMSAAGLPSWTPERPREIGFMPVDGFGLHRIGTSADANNAGRYILEFKG
jgi:hypothetical protein